MRDSQGFAPPELRDESVRAYRIAPVLIAAAVLAALACYVVPRGLEARAAGDQG
jgi:hypothetical protein